MHQECGTMGHDNELLHNDFKHQTNAHDTANTMQITYPNPHKYSTLIGTKLITKHICPC